MLLEVTSDLVEPVPVVQVMYQVGGIEELRNSSVDPLLGLLEGVRLLRNLRVVLLEIELEVRTTIGAVVRYPSVLTLPVLVSEDVVAPRVGGVPEALLVLQL